jgi:DNA-binding CsgD family transcriptional regulator
MMTRACLAKSSNLHKQNQHASSIPPGKKLPVKRGKTKNLKLNSLLDISLSIREANDYMYIHAKVNKFQCFDFVRYMFEMSLMKQFLCSDSKADASGNESSVNVMGKSALDKIYRLNALSKRQREIFEKIMMGKSNDQMVDEMNISLSTIKGHIQELYLKLDVPNRYMATIQYHDIYLKMKKKSCK